MSRVLSLMLAVVLIACYVVYALLRPLPPLQPVVNSHFARAAAPVALTWPHQGSAAIGAAGFGVLASHGDDTPLPTASTIKILTALAVLQKYPLQAGEQGPDLTITQADVDSYAKFVALDGSVVHVQLGEQLSEYQALQALLLPSANNIAETLARWAFGSIDAYNAYANQYAQTLGMNDTHVTDPSGFAPTTTSTPHDLVILGMAAMRSTTLANLVNQSSAQLPVQGTVHNYNVLLGQHGIVGIKTGNNDQDTGAYVFASRQKIGNQSVLIVGAVMNGSSLWGAMQSALPLLASATRGFSVLPVAAAEQAVAAYHPAWGKQIAANTSRSVSLLVWGDSTTTISVTVHKLSIPSLSGRSVGTLTVHNSLTGNTVVNLRVAQTIAEPGTWWRLTHPR